MACSDSNESSAHAGGISWDNSDESCREGDDGSCRASEAAKEESGGELDMAGEEREAEVEEAVQDKVEIVAYRPPGITIRGLDAGREGVTRHAEDDGEDAKMQSRTRRKPGSIEKKRRRRREISSRKETRERWTRFEGPTRRVAEVGQFGRGRGRGREERGRGRGREAWKRNGTPAVLCPGVLNMDLAVRLLLLLASADR